MSLLIHHSTFLFWLNDPSCMIDKLHFLTRNIILLIFIYLTWSTGGNASPIYIIFFYGIKWNEEILAAAVRWIDNEENARTFILKILFIACYTNILSNMPPQIDKTIPLSENGNFEQLSSVDHDQNVFNIQTYLLTLLFMQWVSSI